MGVEAVELRRNQLRPLAGPRQCGAGCGVAVGGSGAPLEVAPGHVGPLGVDQPVQGRVFFGGDRGGGGDERGGGIGGEDRAGSAGVGVAHVGGNEAGFVFGVGGKPGKLVGDRDRGFPGAGALARSGGPAGGADDPVLEVPLGGDPVGVDGAAQLGRGGGKRVGIDRLDRRGDRGGGGEAFFGGGIGEGAAGAGGDEAEVVGGGVGEVAEVGVHGDRAGAGAGILHAGGALGEAGVGGVLEVAGGRVAFGVDRAVHGGGEEAEAIGGGDRGDRGGEVVEDRYSGGAEAVAGGALGDRVGAGRAGGGGGEPGNHRVEGLIALAVQQGRFQEGAAGVEVGDFGQVAGFAEVGVDVGGDQDRVVVGIDGNGAGIFEGGADGGFLDPG